MALFCGSVRRGCHGYYRHSINGPDFADQALIALQRLRTPAATNQHTLAAGVRIFASSGSTSATENISGTTIRLISNDKLKLRTASGSDVLLKPRVGSRFQQAMVLRAFALLQ